MRRAVGLMIVLALGVVAGCGGGETTATTESASAAFIRRADQLCVQEQHRMRAPKETVERSLRRAPTARGRAALVRALRRFGEEIYAANSSLEALEPPPEVRHQWSEMLAVEDAQVRLLLAYAAIVEAGPDRAKVSALISRDERNTVRIETLAREIGFTECGRVELPAAQSPGVPVQS